MKKTFGTLAVAALLLPGALGAQETSFGSPLAAIDQEKQEPKKEPAPAKDEGDKKQELEAQLVALKGTVDVKRPEDKDWVPAERNMKLKKGSEICTAVASSAKLLFTGNIQVEVKALTQAKIEDLAKSGKGVNADVKLKFGSVEVDIKKGDLRSDMKVTAPNSTTSVSGSHGLVRAPAAGGGGKVTIFTTSGTWNHRLIWLDIEQEISGSGLGNDLGDLSRDLYNEFLTDQYLNFFGRSSDELFQSGITNKAGDPNPWDVPLGEWASTGPSAPKGQKTSALPLPPGHP